MSVYISQSVGHTDNLNPTCKYAKSCSYPIHGIYVWNVCSAQALLLNMSAKVKQYRENIDTHTV